MKLYLKPIGAAVGLALLSMSAHAQLAPPAQGSSSGSADNSLYLAVFNSSGATELVNLGYALSDIADGNQANLNTPGAVYTSNVANPTGAAGTVSQLDFGTIANASTFATGRYIVVSAEQDYETNSGLGEITVSSGVNPSATTVLGGEAMINNVQTELATWQSLSTNGTFFDSSGTTSIAAAGTGSQHPLSANGNFGLGTVSAVAVGTAASFYDLLLNDDTGGTVDGVANNKTAANAYAGFFYLSSSGDLTYNIASPVPLPPAVWLFGSGLLGLIGVGRRRQAV